MTWPQHRLAAYEQMVLSIRSLISAEGDLKPGSILSEIELLISRAETISQLPQPTQHEAFSAVPAVGNQARGATEPALQVSSADQLTQSQVLARWLWDRNLDLSATNGLSPERCERFSRAAGLAANPPVEVWTEVSGLLTKMGLLALEEPESMLIQRQFAHEQAHWLESLPAGDPFSHGTKATANRAAKAKTLARWLWDRNIDVPTMFGFSDKFRREIARNAEVNPPSSLTTWQSAAVLMAQMEVMAQADAGNPAVSRNHLDEHDRWATGTQIKP
ncbi:hypothetical protein CQ018_09840 [Arthrobacter sp. MYb227]|uniref:hypothetical protein n=1 Tax=Arthrobacter sp. MYb227 TaxID=1848601 RepID=UPI000CFD23DC|nr:hypothetical protein [Arthrobacter sp. MYb227]PQZ93923.1 hypothetical protein CQ018_09840 [Arthrobacter sp. MYb227]